MDTLKIIEAIPNLDLAEIREKIAQARAERDAVVAEHDKKIASLVQLERVVMAARGEVPEKKPRKPRAPRQPRVAGEPETADSRTIRGRAALYLAHNGPTKFATLATEIRGNVPDLYKLARTDPWFEKDGLNLRLTAVGMRCASPRSEAA